MGEYSVPSTLSHSELRRSPRCHINGSMKWILNARQLLQWSFYAPLLFCLCPPVLGQNSPEKPLLGFSREGAQQQHALEARFDASLNRDHLRDWMKRLTARPHHLGSAYDKENANFIADQFRSW